VVARSRGAVPVVVAAAASAVAAAAAAGGEGQMASSDMRTALISAALGFALPFVGAIAPGGGGAFSASAQTPAASAGQNPDAAQAAATQTSHARLGQGFTDPEQAAAALVTALRTSKAWR
jgi:hypothetical protein